MLNRRWVDGEDLKQWRYSVACGDTDLSFCLWSGPDTRSVIGIEHQYIREWNGDQFVSRFVSSKPVYGPETELPFFFRRAPLDQ